MIPSKKQLVLQFENWMPDTLGNRLSSNLGLCITEMDSPASIRTPETVSVIRFSSTLDVSRYITGVPVDPEASYVVSPEYSFDRLDIPLTGAETADKIIITAEFRSADDQRDTDTFVFQNDDTFTPDDRLEASLTSHIEATEAKVTVEATGIDGGRQIDRLRAAVLRQISGREFVVSNQVRVGIPVARQSSAGPPVFLVSIDTLRWDRQEELEPLITALGGSDTVVSEPRTQGHWTPPSHACMFTGVHPGDHKYVGLDNGATEPINSELMTLGDLLHDSGYKTRGLVSHTRILPEVGFGHGFFQYRLENMGNWLTRKFDAREKVDTLIDWVDRDCRSGDSAGLFYFLHVFDPHMPYVPPLPDDRVNSLQLNEIDQFRNIVRKTSVQPTAPTSTPKIDPELIDTLWSYYNASVEYTAEQITRLVEHLKRLDLFEESLIIITGDHGEEFGEQGLYSHNSLYDNNIRPFMAVKPPKDSEWETPTVADTIDILPTIAQEIGSSVPDLCQGTPWQDNSDRTVRISERIRPDWYNVAVEIKGIKAIFTYKSNYPTLPTEDSISDGPVREEYYRIADLRNDRYEECDPGLQLRKQLLEAGRQHALRDPVASTNKTTHAQVTQDTNERLKHLGYK